MEIETELRLCEKSTDSRFGLEEKIGDSLLVKTVRRNEKQYPVGDKFEQPWRTKDLRDRARDSSFTQESSTNDENKNRNMGFYNWKMKHSRLEDWEIHETRLPMTEETNVEIRLNFYQYEAE